MGKGKDLAIRIYWPSFFCLEIMQLRNLFNVKWNIVTGRTQILHGIRMHIWTQPVLFNEKYVEIKDRDMELIAVGQDTDKQAKEMGKKRHGYC